MNVLSNFLRFSLRTHRPCLYLSMVMAVGIVLGRYGPLAWYSWSILSGILIILSVMEQKWRELWLCLAVLCLGALYDQHTYLFSADHIAFLSYQDQKGVTAVEGVIDSDVNKKPTAFGIKQIFEFQVNQIQFNGVWTKSQGRILVNFFQSIQLSYGDGLKLEGSLYKVSKQLNEKFSYQQYLEEHGLFFNFSVGKAKKIEWINRGQGQWLLAIAFKMKHRFKLILSKYLEPFETSVIQAMVLGDRTLMTKDIYALFSKTGTSHILAISGMNMAIISAIFLFILKVLRLPRTWQFMLTGLFLLFYALLSGWSASVVRSVLMAIVLLSSFCVEHEIDALNSLGLAALILFLFNPSNLFDVGFQLSFLSVGIIIGCHPLLQAWVDQHTQSKLQQCFAQALGVSLIVWIGISGLIAYEFQMVTPIAIMANIPIVFLADVIIFLSLGLLMMGIICPMAAFAFAGTIKLVFHSTLQLTAWFAQIPGGYFYIAHIKIIHIFSYYCILIIVYLVIQMKITAYNSNK